MPKAVGFPTAYNATNMLRGLTPTFVDWGTNPGSLDNMTDEKLTALGTPGIIPAFTTGLIVFDLGREVRILASLYEESNVAVGASIDVGSDGVQYYSRAYSNSSLYPTLFMSGKGRYLRYNCNKATGCTISKMSLCCYRL